MSTHLFFDNIFCETHEELTDLQESFSKMQISFQSNSNFNEEAEQEMLVVDITKNLDNIEQVFLERKNPLGLSADRKKYLSEEVSKYVQNPVKKSFYCEFS